jgi:predicted nucleic acid-binding protein
LIVIDASALLEILLRTNRAERLMERAFSSSERLHSPHLIDVEVTQALRRLAQHGDVTIARAAQALDDLASVPLERHAHQLLLPRIWQLRDSLSAYDGAYVALAEALDAPVLTCDAKLARAHGYRAHVELIERPG